MSAMSYQFGGVMYSAADLCSTATLTRQFSSGSITPLITAFGSDLGNTIT